MAFCTIVCCLESQHEESATQEWEGKNKQTNKQKPPMIVWVSEHETGMKRGADHNDNQGV